ncbi:MAG: hypothetical protein A2W11_02780 [Ignavibacteria bacterium RBG_16_35_7]|nr:MAG: hypothetical protein A2W11_02780 [Ignavibacteria bacterium RBG_16_35_7]
MNNTSKNSLTVVLLVLAMSGCFLGRTRKENNYRKNIVGTWQQPGVTDASMKIKCNEVVFLDSLILYGAKQRYKIVGDTLVLISNKYLPGNKIPIVSLTHDTMILLESPGLKETYIRKK